jgi:hypothetical protein
MADAKPFASLSSGLLARKGGAKPAMRPQGFGSFGGSLEDLGWNDMGGHEYGDHVPTPIDALTPSPKSPAPAPVVVAIAVPAPETAEASEPLATEAPELVPVRKGARAKASARKAAPPKVVEQQRALRESFETAPEAEVVALPQRSSPAAKAKAAFTLRLDPDRHLRLRLATALTRRSAQQLVTAALDEFLATMPELEVLADRVPAAPQARRGTR